jgi:hypothetical protein
VRPHEQIEIVLIGIELINPLQVVIPPDHLIIWMDRTTEESRRKREGKKRTPRETFPRCV